MTVFPTAQVDAFPPGATGPENATIGELLPMLYYGLHVSCVFSWAVNKVNDTPEGDLDNGASLLNGEEEEKLIPPNLETFIPAECLPDIIDVYMDNHFIHNDLYSPYSGFEKLPDLKGTIRKPIKFVRQYPARTPTDEGKFDTSCIQSRLRMVDGDQVVSMGQDLQLMCQTVTVPKQK